MKILSTAIATLQKMQEASPEEAQERVVEHLREYIPDLQDELQWDALFKRTQAKPVGEARRAKEEIAAGKADTMGFERL